MRPAILLAFVVAISGGAAWAQTDPMLPVQQKMETWTYWMMVTGAASAVVASLSFVAVLLTFASQRKLAQDTEAAVIVVTAGKLRVTPSVAVPILMLELLIENRGRTHATGVEMDAFLDVTKVGQESKSIIKLEARMKSDFLTAGDSAVVTAWIVKPVEPTEETTLSMIAEGERKMRYTGTVFIGGRVRYRDFAGRRRFARIPAMGLVVEDGTRFDLRNDTARARFDTF